MLGNLRVVSIPFVIPLIKGTMIAQGGIEDPNVVGKVVEYHSVAAEWLCLMNMESRCSSKMWCDDGDKQWQRENVAKDIATSYDYDIFIKVFMGASNNSVSYRTVKNLVDNFKIKKLNNHIQEHPKERETIPKSIDPNCNSKSIETIRSPEFFCLLHF